jgi:hypothetical protein
MSKQIPLTRGKFAIVDDEFYDELSKYEWSIDGSGYPQRSIKCGKGWKPIRMHRIVMGLVGRQMADHINLNKLDTRVCNLRICNAEENVRHRGINKNNKSGYKGVYYNKNRNVYQSYITVSYSHFFIGAFLIPREAAEAYDKRAIELFGEFAMTNKMLGLL